MDLFTECTWGDWHRVVDIYPERCGILPEYINDPGTYKLILLEKGALKVNEGDVTVDVAAPSIILLSQKDRIEYKVLRPVKACILYFKPTVIRDEFTFDRIDSGEFDELMGQVIYQDYMMVRFFNEGESIRDRIFKPELNEFMHLKELYTSAEIELKGQADGFWPCRSRSYLIELLYTVVYSYFIIKPEVQVGDKEEFDEFSRIADYLNEHLSENITVDTITGKFLINRNKLNGLFMKCASMTCMNYLLMIRLDLAKLILSKTEIPVSEVSSRVGYHDANYFAKVFRKAEGMSPSQYRTSST